ncbi:PEP/pyruvate-binding domain-containing protein [Azorhizobium doebereinerae]|uniref:PEP/pyruvate-binding domain-containing protein n=1 Tax=Azorhizobium doebereinerae TaxID=281091 RepID=UPI0004264EF9|nr:PEP/pyruvate-binding domain-containing protein [Azorhizobium doebereinerae]
MQIVRIGNGSTEQPTPETVGAKAANLARMAVLGLPVPPAFVLPVGLCAAIVRGERDARERMETGLAKGIAFLEEATGRTFGDGRRPLLVSVRSGAARSMPGMLETVLDVGCSHAATQGLIRMTGHPRFAWDCRRRFLESYGNVVLGVPDADFARARRAVLTGEGVADPQDLDGEALERLAEGYAALLEDRDDLVPDQPMAQLRGAAEAVYGSWMSPRAAAYRRIEHLEHLEGTAVTVQAMVFGNRGATSGAGVAFSRNPSTGATAPMIDVLLAAQGEDVVSGSRTPLAEDALAAAAPVAAAQLREVLARLEGAFGDVQDVEFTVEEGKLYILQTRAAKRTPAAALRFAVAQVEEGLITPAEGLARLAGVDLDALVTTRLAEAWAPVATGTAASTGVAVGRVAFSSERAQELAAAGEPVILVRPDTSTLDVVGFSVAAGIVTAVGGRTAHAALVARQMGKPCVVGCAAVHVEPSAARAQIAGHPVAEGDWLSIDGRAGTIHLGRSRIVTERPDADLARVASWRQAAREPACA